MRKMNETKEMIKGLKFKIDKQEKAKISKLNKIKSEFKLKLENLSQNSRFKLDFNQYKSIDELRTVLFSSLFSIPKNKSDSATASINSNTIKTKVIYFSNFIFIK
jgi:hypothetical protein